MLKDYYIGELVASKAGAEKAKAAVSDESSLITLNPKAKVALKLSERIEVGFVCRSCPCLVSVATVSVVIEERVSVVIVHSVVKEVRVSVVIEESHNELAERIEVGCLSKLPLVIGKGRGNEHLTYLSQHR
jgi:hypothetical protein